MARAIVNTIGADCLQDLGFDFKQASLQDVVSWTTFMKDTSKAVTEKSKIQYLPGIPFPTEDNVIKYYLDMIVALPDKLGLNHVFVHTDEATNSKIAMIMWLHKSKYDKIVPILGGFHTLLVYLKILYKKYGCLGFQNWWVDT